MAPKVSCAAIAVSAVVGIVVVVLVLAACSGAGSSSAPGVAQVGSSAGSASSAPNAARTSIPSAVAYSSCMRNRGVPDYPDPTSSNAVIKVAAQQLGISATRLQAAQHDCEHLLRISGDNVAQQQELQCAETGDCSGTVVQQWMTGLRSLARCLRAHGEPNWPDPVVTALGGYPASPHFLYDQAGIDHHSATVLHEVGECVRIVGFQGLPLP